MIRYLCPLALVLATQAAAADCVVLLHGLARTANSMEKIEEALEEAGYEVANIGYPSRKYPVEELAPMAVGAGLAACPQDARVHFVTHSLGGILVRYSYAQRPIERLGRVVMLGPPNQGSHVVDDYRDVPGYAAINGPAGMQLGTDEDGIPAQLGPVTFELGVIAGNDTFNPILSQSLPNPDDGKVSVEHTKVEGMADHLVVPRSHPFLMTSKDVIAQILHFIEHGRFDHPPTDPESTG